MRGLKVLSRLLPLVAIAALAGTLQLACGSAAGNEADTMESSTGSPPPTYPDGGGEFKIPIGQKDVGPLSDDLLQACGMGMCTPGGDPVECATAGSTMLQDSGPQQVFCQIVPIDTHLESRCLPVGQQGETQPCKTSADCAAGLGCVGDPAGGVCRKYCCGDPEQMCPKDTYCARELLAGYLPPSLIAEIPACIPATQCQLLDDSTCPAGRTCSIVRADGTTSCTEPGQGTLGQDCPCAAGFVCIHSTSQCKQLCHLGHDDECTLGAKCLGGSASYPEGFGVCVGESG
jgi:hypothetical protein